MASNHKKRSSTSKAESSTPEKKQKGESSDAQVAAPIRGFDCPPRQRITRQQGSIPQGLESGKVHKGAKSYFSDVKNEAKITAYCGFSDVGDFRRFLMSFPVQEAYRSLKSGSPKVPQNNVWGPIFQELHDAAQESERTGTDAFEAKFGWLVDLDAKYPVGTDNSDPAETVSHKLSRQVAIYYRMKTDIEGYYDLDPATRASRTTQTHKVWEDNFAASGLKLPKIDPEKVQMAQLGPFTELGEDYMEPFARIFAILSIFTTHMGQKRLKNFIDSQDPFKSKPVPKNAIPRWMIHEGTAPSQIAQEKQADQARLKPKKFAVRWVLTKNTVDAKELIAANDLDMEITTKQIANEDPRLLSGPEFRDSIKHQFKMLRLGGSHKFHFAGMQLKWMDGEEQSFANMLELDWNDDIQPLLLTKPEAELEIMFWVRLMGATERELESSAIPATMAHILQIGLDGLPELRPANNDDKTTDQPMQENMMSEPGEPLIPENLPSASANENGLEAEEPEQLDEIADEKPEGEIFAEVQKVHRQRIPFATPESRFEGRPIEELLAFYSGFNTTIPEELEKWQIHVCGKLAAKAVFTAHQESDNERMQNRAVEMITSAMADTVSTYKDLDDMTPQQVESMYRIQAAFTGTAAQTGPDILICQRALGFEPIPGDEMKMPINKALLLENVKAKLYDYQVSAVAHMLGNVYGRIPMRKVPQAKQDKQAIDELRRPRLTVTFLCDLPGIGKTIAFLTFLQWTAEHAPLEKFDDTSPRYRPQLLVLPPSVIPQVVGIIYNLFPALFLVISYNDDEMNKLYKNNYVSNTQMKKVPAPTAFPKKLRFVLDQNDPRAAYAVIVTSYETMIRRNFTKVPVLNKKNGLPVLNAAGEKVEVWRTNLKDVIRTIVVDEAHKVKNSATLASRCLRLINAASMVVVTATPIMHGIEDMVGMLRLVWKSSRAEAIQQADTIYLRARPKDSEYDSSDISKVEDEKETFTAEDKKKNFHGFQKLHEKYTGIDLYIAVGKLPRNDPRRYYVLRPSLFTELISAYRHQSKAIMGKCFPVLADMLILARSYTSRLKHSGRPGGILDMSKFIKGHSFITLKLDFRQDTDEETTFQFLHLLSALAYDRQIAGPKDNAPPSKVADPAVRGRKDNKPSGAFATKALRQLAILTSGVVPGLFDARARAVGRSTLVADTQRWRDKGYSIEFFVKAILKPNEALPTTALAWLDRFCYGSPKFRILFKLILDVCINLKTKLLVTEGNVLNASEIEEACNFLHIECAVMHSGLSSAERVALAKRFRHDPEPSKLMLLVIMYDVSGLGIDLYEQCYHVLVFSPAKNGLIENQAVCRVVRAPQGHWVKIYRLSVINSHDEYRNSRQMDKYLVQLASRLEEPGFRAELLNCLEIERQAVIKISETPLGQKVLRGIASGKIHRVTREVLEESDSGSDDDEEQEEDPAGTGDGYMQSTIDKFVADDALDSDDEALIPKFKVKPKAKARDSSDRFEQDEGFDELIHRLQLDTSRPFVDSDLENDTVIQLALSLIYKKRLGAEDSTYRKSIHIHYSKLSAEVQMALQASMENMPKNIKARFDNVGHKAPRQHVDGPLAAPSYLPDFDSEKVFTAANARSLFHPNDFTDEGYSLYEALEDDGRSRIWESLDKCLESAVLITDEDEPDRVMIENAVFQFYNDWNRAFLTHDGEVFQK